MNANPAQFEAIGTRLGFRVVEQTPDRVRLLWRGPRFPAFLCLGIALLLLFISVPIVEAIRIRGFVGPAGSLWYFPLMNLILFGIAFFLLTQRRTIEIEPGAGRLSLRRHSLYRSVGFTAASSEIAESHPRYRSRLQRLCAGWLDRRGALSSASAAARAQQR